MAASHFSDVIIQPLSGCDIHSKYHLNFATIRWRHWLLLPPVWLRICMLCACFIWNNCVFCLERISAFGCLSKETSWHPCTLTTHRSCHQYYHVTQLDETPCGWCPFPCEVWFSRTWLEKLVGALLIWDLPWHVWLHILLFVISFFLICLFLGFFIFPLTKDKHAHRKLTTISLCINFWILIPPLHLSSPPCGYITASP